jgi:hypothetical protein
MPPTAVAAIEISRIDAVGEVRRLRDMGMEKLCGLWARKWGAVAPCVGCAREPARVTHNAQRVTDRALEFAIKLLLPIWSM